MSLDAWPWRLGMEIPDGLSITERAELARWAEDRGFEDAWTAEITDPNAFVILTAAALRTSRIRLGTAIIPIGTRTAPALAAAAGSMCALAPGRFALGVGVSSRVIIEDWHGVPYDRPLERARETLVTLRAVLTGERTNMAGRQVRSHGFRLRHPPPAPPPILLAALNERMLELAGELADGVYLNFLPVEAVSQAIGAVRRGAERAGRAALPELILSIACCVSDKPESAREEFRRSLAFYLTAPAYQKALAWYGFAAEVEQARAAWARRDLAGVCRAISDRLLDGIGAFGSAAFCCERVAAFGKAGIGTLSITTITADPRGTLAAFVR
jgi:probable F420-dependent oxidoreductase